MNSFEQGMHRADQLRKEASQLNHIVLRPAELLQDDDPVAARRKKYRQAALCICISFFVAAMATFLVWLAVASALETK